MDENRSTSMSLVELRMGAWRLKGCAVLALGLVIESQASLARLPVLPLALHSELLPCVQQAGQGTAVIIRPTALLCGRAQDDLQIPHQVEAVAACLEASSLPRLRTGHGKARDPDVNGRRKRGAVFSVLATILHLLQIPIWRLEPAERISPSDGRIRLGTSARRSRMSISLPLLLELAPQLPL
jgi:hypothetical protein